MDRKSSGHGYRCRFVTYLVLSISVISMSASPVNSYHMVPICPDVSSKSIIWQRDGSGLPLASYLDVHLSL